MSNPDGSSRVQIGGDDEAPLITKTSSLDKDKSDKEPGEKAVGVTLATAEEAPFGTQIFWLVVWMLK